MEGIPSVGRRSGPHDISLHPFAIHHQNGSVVHLHFASLSSAPAATVPEVSDEQAFEQEEYVSRLHRRVVGG